MSSDTAMNKHHGGIAEYRSSEGRTVTIPYKGDINTVVKDILGGLRSTCTYVGALTLKQLAKCTTFIRVNRQINDVYVK
jgi:GMP reductase